MDVISLFYGLLTCKKRSLYFRFCRFYTNQQKFSKKCT